MTDLCDWKGIGGRGGGGGGENHNMRERERNTWNGSKEGTHGMGVRREHLSLHIMTSIIIIWLILLCITGSMPRYTDT